MRLSFDDWALLHGLAGGDAIDGYYLNGYGVQGLILAVMQRDGLDTEEGVHGNSEADTCHLHFTELTTAERAAAAAVAMLETRDSLREAVVLARELGLED